MIARHWRGWTLKSDADAYESILKERVLPALREIPGYKGGYVLRRESVTETEFVVVNFFESLDAVRGFAGDEYERPVFEPEARRLLSRIDETATHYEVKANITAANT